MKRIVVIAIVLAGARVAHAQMMSPGPLSAPHADLEGDDHCDDCHEAGEQVSASKCLACHKPLAARIDAGAGLHGRNYQGQACEGCHHEHIGRNTKLVRWPGGSMESLDHDDAGWKLDGEHADTKCLDCHKKKTSGGRTTFLGLSTSCTACHKDQHTGRFGSSCLGCHDQSDWKNLSLDKFDHDLAKFKLTGAHKTTKCEKCHGTPSKWTGISFGGCAICHDDPHKGKFLPAKCEDCHQTQNWKTDEKQMREHHSWLSLKHGHARVACGDCHDRGNSKPPSAGSRCNDCHRAVHVAKFGTRCETCHGSIEWTGLPDRVGRDNHDKTAYPLEGKHADVDCDRCHPKSKSPDKRWRKVAFDRCAACHADEHAGEFAGKDCATCHKLSGFRTTSFGVERHATTAFALDGRHVAVPCAGCHGAKEPRKDLRNPKRACAECHDNPHGDQFAREMKQGGCAECHVTSDWKQAKFDHSTFPLTGAHATVACGSCHPGAEKANPAQPAAFRGVPRTCEGCHDDVHAGQFRSAAPVKACDGCHDTTAFKIARFDHAKQSGYALEGKHATVECKACHPSVELASGQKAVRYRLGYRRCKDCHADPHKGSAQ